MIAAARVLVVGVGGLGCPLAMALVRAGVAAVGLVDEDLVEASNLHRQILFGEEDVGTPKVVAAARALEIESRRAGSPTRLEPHLTHLLPSNAVELMTRYDLVVEGSDNFPTKFLAADAARLAERPIVHGAAVRFRGNALAVSARGRPCYRCLFEDVPSEHVPSCADAGVMGPVVGVVAAAQADLALRALAGEDVFGELFDFEGRRAVVRRRRVARRASCALCGESRAIADVTASRYGAGERCALVG